MAWLDDEDLRGFEVHVCNSHELVDWLWRVWVGELTPGQERAVWDAIVLEAHKRGRRSAASIAARYRVGYEQAHAMLIASCFIYLKGSLESFLSSTHPGWPLVFANGLWQVHHDLVGSVNHRAVPLTYVGFDGESEDAARIIPGSSTVEMSDIPGFMDGATSERIIETLVQAGVPVGGAMDSMEIVWRTLIELKTQPNDRDRGASEVWWDKASGKFRNLLRARARSLTDVADLIWELITGPVEHREYGLLARLSTVDSVEGLPEESRLWVQTQLLKIKNLMARGAQPTLFDLIPDGGVRGDTGGDGCGALKGEEPETAAPKCEEAHVETRKSLC